MKNEIFCLSCYGEPDGYVFMIPLSASTRWLQKALGRKNLVSGVPLQEKKVLALRPKLPNFAEIGFSPRLKYFVERINL